MTARASAAVGGALFVCMIVCMLPRYGYDVHNRIYVYASGAGGSESPIYLPGILSYAAFCVAVSLVCWGVHFAPKRTKGEKSDQAGPR